jgi:hypothetical protein
MPLKLVPPRSGKSPNFTIRGTYLKQHVNRSAGTGDKAKAKQLLRKIERDIERGAFSDKPGPTFAGAAIAYMRAGGDNRFVAPLLKHFRETPLADIDQAAIDNAAQQLYPLGGPATRNRQVYTPVSSILKHVGVDFVLKRPKGADGERKTDWLREDEAFRLFARPRRSTASSPRSSPCFATPACG